MEETAALNQTTLPKHAIRFGGVLGIIGILLSLVIYIADVSWFASLWLLLIVMVINIGFTAYASINYRNLTGGYLQFKHAFLHGALVIFTAMVIGGIFRIILFNVIDPQLGQTVTDITVEKWTAMMEGWNTPADKIDEAVEKMRRDMPEGFTPVGILISIFWPGLLITAIAALISGLIAKRKEPEVM